MLPILWVYRPGYYITMWIVEHVFLPIAAFDPFYFVLGLTTAISLLFVWKMK